MQFAAWMNKNSGETYVWPLGTKQSLSIKRVKALIVEFGITPEKAIIHLSVFPTMEAADNFITEIRKD